MKSNVLEAVEHREMTLQFMAQIIDSLRANSCMMRVCRNEKMCSFMHFTKYIIVGCVSTPMLLLINLYKIVYILLSHCNHQSE